MGLLTNDNSLTSLHDRQRTLLKHSRPCLENHTKIDSYMREKSDEEVDHGSYGVNAIPQTDSDRAWSTYEFSDKGICLLIYVRVSFI